MTKCAYCGTVILAGGQQVGDARFCNADCQRNGMLLAIAEQIPPEIVEETVKNTHSGVCPRCGGGGPVDVHVSYRIWSAIAVTNWCSRQHVCCARCGKKSIFLDLCFSLFLGWWGFPWGLALTPIQVARNLIGLLRTPDFTQPSDRLQTVIKAHLAASLFEAPQELQPTPR